MRYIQVNFPLFEGGHWGHLSENLEVNNFHASLESRKL